MRDITSTFTEFGPRAKRKLPSEAAVADLFAGTKQAADEMMSKLSQPSGVDFGGLVQPKTGPESVEGQKMKMFGGALQGLSKMGGEAPPPMSPIMMGDPIQLQEQNISRLTGLQGYYDGGEFDDEEAFVVSDGEIVVPKKGGGGTVVPAKAVLQDRFKEWQTPVEPDYSGQGRGVEAEMASPDPRRLLSPQTATQTALNEARDFNPDFGERQTSEDPLATAEAKLLEASQLKPSKWKDFGYSLVQGLNNYFNKTNDTKTYSEIQRDRRVAQIAPQVELLRRKKAEAAAAEDTRIKQDLTKAQTDYTRGRLPAEAAEQSAKTKEKARTLLARMNVINPDDPNTQKIAADAGHTPEELQAMKRDFRNRQTMKVGDDVWQNDNGVWKVTGIKEATERVTLSVPIWNERTGQWDKETRVMELPKSKAAQTMAGLQRAGMQIEAAADRNTSTIQGRENLETLKQQGQQTLARLRSELAEKGKMSAAERKKKEKQVSELEIVLQAKGEAIPQQ